jgi:hypothetical protein
VKSASAYCRKALYRDQLTVVAGARYAGKSRSALKPRIPRIAAIGDAPTLISCKESSMSDAGRSISASERLVCVPQIVLSHDQCSMLPLRLRSPRR